MQVGKKGTGKAQAMETRKLQFPKLSVTDLIGLLTLTVQALFMYKWILHPAYIHSYMEIAYQSGYENDIYLRDSMLQTSNIVYGILQLGLDNLIVSPEKSFFLFLVFYFLCSAIAYKFIRDAFGFRKLESWLFLTVSIFTMSMVVHGPRGVVFPNDVINPTMFNHLLWLTFLYALFSKKHFWATATTLLMLLIHLKSAWFPLGLTLFSILFDKELQTNHKIRLITFIAFACVLIINLLASENISYNTVEALEVSQFIIERNGSEDAFNLLPNDQLVKLFIAFTIFPILLKNVGGHIKKTTIITAWKIYFCSIILVIVGTFYTSFGYKILRIPELILLSPVRATQTFIFVFWIFVFSFLFQQIKKQTYKSLLSIFALHSILIVGSTMLFSGFNYIALCFAAISLFLCIAIFSIKTDVSACKIHRFSSSVMLILVLFTSVPPSAKAFLLLYENYSTIGTAIPLKINKPLFDDLQALKTQKDFNLLIVKNQNGRYVIDLHLNYISRKSQYLGDGANFYLNFDGQQRHMKRQVIANELLRNFNEQSDFINENALKEIYNRNLTLLIPSQLASNFPDHLRQRVQSDQYYLITANNL